MIASEKDREDLDRDINAALERAQARQRRSDARADGIVLARTILAYPATDSRAMVLARVFLASHGEDA